MGGSGKGLPPGLPSERFTSIGLAGLPAGLPVLAMRLIPIHADYPIHADLLIYKGSPPLGFAILCAS